MKKNIVLALFLNVFILSACATSTEHVVNSSSDHSAVAALPAPTQTVENKKQETPAAATEALAHGAALPTIVLKKKEVAHADAHAASTHTPATHHTAEGVAPEQAMKWLKNGNKRFLKGFFRKDGATKADVERLSKGQKPHSIVLSCSDSRVPPEVVFDQKLGEIFTVRTAGEALDSSAIASIEYAVEHLGAKNILVMGHTQCGAVKAAIGTFGGKDAGSPSLNKLVADIQPRIQQFEGKEPSKNYEAEGWANTNGVAKDLLMRSSIIAEKVKAGEVKISSALYHLDSGKAEFEK